MVFNFFDWRKTHLVIQITWTPITYFKTKAKSDPLFRFLSVPMDRMQKVRYQNKPDNGMDVKSGFPVKICKIAVHTNVFIFFLMSNPGSRLV